MASLMCLSCGEFVRAFPDDGSLVPFDDRCPNCGGAEFKDNDTGERVRTDADTD